MNGCDTAWMLVATALVLLMTPALGFFYGGLVRAQERAQHVDDELLRARLRRPGVGACSATRSPSAGIVAGGRRRSFALLRGVGLEAQGTIPHLLFLAYQGTFAIITAALISGRDRRADAVRRRTSRSSRSGRSSSTRRSRTGCGAAAGWQSSARSISPAARSCTSTPPRPRWSCGAGRRAAQGLRAAGASLPHNVPFTLLGAGLLWFGWFGFNAGSALAANAQAALAFVNTMLAPTATLVVWTLLDLMRTGKATAVGAGDGNRRRARGDHARGRASSARCRAIVLGAHRGACRATTRCCGARARGSTTRSTSSPRTASAASSARCSPACSRRTHGTAPRTACCSATPQQFGVQAIAVARDHRLQRASMTFVILQARSGGRVRCAPTPATKGSASTSRSTARRRTRAAKARS